MNTEVSRKVVETSAAFGEKDKKKSLLFFFEVRNHSIVNREKMVMRLRNIEKGRASKAINHLNWSSILLLFILYDWYTLPPGNSSGINTKIRVIGTHPILFLIFGVVQLRWLKPKILQIVISEALGLQVHLAGQHKRVDKQILNKNERTAQRKGKHQVGVHAFCWKLEQIPDELAQKNQFCTRPQTALRWVHATHQKNHRKITSIAHHQYLLVCGGKRIPSSRQIEKSFQNLQPHLSQRRRTATFLITRFWSKRGELARTGKVVPKVHHL